MGKIYQTLEPKLQDWIKAQKMFFVSTAPLSKDGLVNCSPKGLDTFRILDENTVAYLDLTGSGVETIAHLKENQRITIMFCAFDGPPKIVRLYGKGIVYQNGSTEFEKLSTQFDSYIGARSIIKIEVTRIADSCGYAVPKYEYVEDRDVLQKWCENKGEAVIKEYQKEKNRESLDGLPAFEI